MAIDFPASPTNGQTFTSGSVTYTWDGTKWTAVAAGGGATDKITEGNTSAEVIDTGSDGRFVVTTEGTERARVDSSGRLLAGTSSSSVGTRLVLQGNSSNAANQAILHLQKGSANPSTVDQIGEIKFADSNGSVGAEIAAYNELAWATNDYPTRLVFSTTADGASSPTERMRIFNSGRIDMLSANFVGTKICSTLAASVDNYLILGESTRSSIAANDGTTRFIVYTNGNVQNSNNSYAGISDIKLKENVIDASSQWEDLKALQVRKYNFKEETGQQTHTQIGLIAQEVELVSPGLVTESPDRDAEGNDLGTVTKSVNYSVLYMKAVKALQEAMERIESLEAKVAALESA